MHTWLCRAIPAFIVAVVFLLAACGTSDNPLGGASGSITVLSANGSVVLSGSWSGCSGGGPYNEDTYTITGSTFQFDQTNGHSASDCLDAPSGSLSITIALSTDGTKSVQFSTDGSVADTPPAGLSSPVSVTRVAGNVTASAGGGAPPVGTAFKDVWYIDDNGAPLVLYRGHGSADPDGYPPFLHKVDTLSQ